jgi:MFS transporter, DHA1 family, tetracycline resistance protein
MKTRILIVAACLISLLSTVGASLPYPILPPLFAADASNGLNHFLGLPAKLLFGLALAINPLGLLIGSAVFGPLSDRFGRRPVLLGTSLGAAIGHAVTAWALLLQSYPLFVLARFVTGLLEGSGSVARALLADRLDGLLRVRAMSWLNGANYMGWLAGPLLAGATVAWGVTVPFWLACAALVLTAALIAFALAPELPSKGPSSWWQVLRQRHALNLLRYPELRSLFIVQLAYCCGVTAFYEFFPLWLVEMPAFGARGIAGMSAALCAVMTATSLFAGRANGPDALQRARVFAFGTAAAIAVLALGNTWTGLGAIVLFGVPNAFYNAIVPSWSAERFGEHGQGAVMGLISTTFCLANIFMAILGGLLTLVDTRLILLFGAAMTGYAGWCIQGWNGRMKLAAQLQRTY